MEWYFIFVPLVLFFGIITSSSDLRKGKIYNKHIISFLGISLIIHFLLLFLGFIQLSYMYKLSINIFIVFLLSIVLWEFKLWSAADAKLFITYSFIIPLFFYSNSGNFYEFFPSFSLLINSFVPFFLFSFFKVSFSRDFKKKLKTVKDIGLIEIIKIILIIFSFLWIPRILYNVYGINLGFMGGLSFVLVTILLFNKLLGNRFIFVLIFLSIARVIFDFNYISTISFLKEFALLSLIMVLVLIIIEIGKDFFTKSIKIENLEPGMFLEEKLHNKENKPLDIENPITGLTSEDIKTIEKFRNSNELKEDKVRIHKMIPFAPFMFFGAIMTLIFKGDFVLGLFKLLL